MPQVKLSRLVKDYNLYPRADVNTYHVHEMVEALKAGVTFPPILVDKETFQIVDGFHRATAYQRYLGIDAEIQAELRVFESDSARFETAMRMNAGHGRRLSSYDKAHCLAIADSLKVERSVVAACLNLTHEKLENIALTRLTDDGQPLKRTMAHFAGETLNPAQQAANRRAGGMNQLFYIRQVISLLESDTINWADESIAEGLKQLQGALSKAMDRVLTS